MDARPGVGLNRPPARPGPPGPCDRAAGTGPPEATLRGRPPSPLRRRLALALPAAPLVAAAGCATAPVPAPPGADPLPAPRLAVGDRWRYALTDLYNGGALGEAAVEVRAVAPEIRLAVRLPGAAAPVEERYADAWTVISEAVFDRPVTYETPMPLVPPGARAGQSSASSTGYRAEGTARRLRWQQRWRALGWERVTVPAGAFDALRIERLVNFEHPDPFRYDPFRRDVLWYAPAAGRWVRREWTGDYMSGGPVPRASRSLEERVRWELLGAR